MNVLMNQTVNFLKQSKKTITKYAINFIDKKNTLKTAKVKESRVNVCNKPYAVKLL